MNFFTIRQGISTIIDINYHIYMFRPYINYVVHCGNIICMTSVVYNNLSDAIDYATNHSCDIDEHTSINLQFTVCQCAMCQKNNGVNF